MSGKNATERLAADAEGIQRAAAILRSGGLVAVPTETVYGLAARADDAEAVAKIYLAKGRPSFNPVIVHIADLAAAEQLVELDERAGLLAQAFWPGPLTLVARRKAGATLAEAVTAGLPTLAIRMPSHPVMRAILKTVGAPLAAPSANASETVSPTDPAHVLKTLDGRIDAIIDGGLCEAGLESTIVALREGGGWQLLRPGPIAETEIAAILGSETAGASTTIEAPGQLARHYAPGKPVRLNAHEAHADEFLLGFGAVAGDWNLSESADCVEAAARLYAGLHRAAEASQPRVAVAPIPDEGPGSAINDRLRRAAT